MIIPNMDWSVDGKLLLEALVLFDQDIACLPTGGLKSLSCTPVSPDATLAADTNFSTPTGRHIPSFLWDNSNLFRLVQALYLHSNTHDPMVTLRTASSLKRNRPPGDAESRNVPQFLSRLTFCVGHEERLSFTMPNHKTSHGILVLRGPAVLAIDTRQGMVPRMVTIKALVLVEKIPFCD